MSRPVRVLLCDDQALVRLHARRILESDGRFEVVGEAADGAAGVALALELKPDLVLMDVNLPYLPGSEATRRILSADPRLKVLAFSSESKRQVVLEMFAAGARGYVLKNHSHSELLLAALTVMAKGFFTSPGIEWH